MAWTELAQLAQCKGKIQEGNYDFQENQMNILHKSQCINDVYSLVIRIYIILILIRLNMYFFLVLNVYVN